MKLGISCGCWYPDLTENSVEKIKNTGYSAAEVFLCDDSECREDFLLELKRRLDFCGIEVVSVHPCTSYAEQYLFFSEYERRTENSFDFYRRYHKAGHILGAECINFHGATVATEPQRYAEIYGRLYAEAKAEGIVFCQENVRKFLSGKVEFLRELKRLSGENIAFTLDVKQTHMEGEDMDEMIALMGKDLRLVHISDHTAAEPCLLPGFGDFDIAAFVGKLRNIGYDGYLITEVYSKNYGDGSDIEKSHRYMKKIINNIQEGQII